MSRRIPFAACLQIALPRIVAELVCVIDNGRLAKWIGRVITGLSSHVYLRLVFCREIREELVVVLHMLFTPRMSYCFNDSRLVVSMCEKD